MLDECEGYFVRNKYVIFSTVENQSAGKITVRHEASQLHS